ncbi:MAG: DUF2157 domain-containing protein [Candidatus Omnitrophica bacterium]|nr:DUF2157 domain-containing protein [Candidatus Omnitrophota bacterium]
MHDEHHPKRKLHGLFARWLDSQLNAWRKADILNASEEERIRTFYDWPQTAQAKSSPLPFIVVLQAIGVLLIGAGIISLIAFNWIKLENLAKFGIILCGLVLIYCTAFLVLRRKSNLQKTGVSLILLGNLLYGGGIWLLAQMYHIHCTFSEGVFLWALGVIPFAYAVKSRLNYYMAIALFIMWVLAESGGSHPPQAVFLFIILGLLIPLSYDLRDKKGLAFCIVTAAAWLVISTVFWFRGGFSVEFFIPLLLYGILLLAVSNLHLGPSLRIYRGIYFDAGVAILAIVFFLVPIFGALARGLQVLMSPGAYRSFWVYSASLCIATLVCRESSARTSLDTRGKLINRLIPYFFVATSYILFVPSAKPSFLANLFPLVLVAFMHWHYSRSRLLLNFVLLYFAFCLPASLADFHQTLLVFILYLICGIFCYMLGWFYVARFDAREEAGLLKILGLLLMFFSLFIFSFSSVAGHFYRNFKFSRSFDFWLIFICFYAAILFFRHKLSTFVYPAYKRGLLREESCLISILPFAPLMLLINFRHHPADFWYTFLVNVFYLGVLIGYITAGYRRNQTYLRVIAFLFLILVVVSRYFELEWSLLYKAVLFISTGVFILAAGIIIEKNKTKVVVIEEE